MERELKSITIAQDTLCMSRCVLDSDSSKGSVRFHNVITAFFLRLFGKIIEVQDKNTGKIYYLNKGSYEKWKHKALPLPQPPVIHLPQVPKQQTVIPSPQVPQPPVIPLPQAVKDASVNGSDNFSQLQQVILKLKNGNVVARKKAYLFENAIALFTKNKCSSNVECRRLKAEESFASHRTVPAYFQDIFVEKSHAVRVNSAFYDYSPTANKEDYWVDFANSSLGGACFTHGFVQEEIMVAEMPEFAELVAGHPSDVEGWCAISTRKGNVHNRMNVLKGSPTPFLMKGLTRVQAVNNDNAYGKLLHSVLIENNVTSLPAPQRINVLAIAAPKLRSREAEEQCCLKSLQDLFNTLMAGFTLVKENGSNVVIHSGKLGCGVFNNSPRAVYLLHRLAAAHMGVDLVLHGYSEKEEKLFSTDWMALCPKLASKSIHDCVALISQYIS